MFSVMYFVKCVGQGSKPDFASKFFICLFLIMIFWFILELGSLMNAWRPSPLSLQRYEKYSVLLGFFVRRYKIFLKQHIEDMRNLGIAIKKGRPLIYSEVRPFFYRLMRF